MQHEYLNNIPEHEQAQIRTKCCPPWVYAQLWGSAPHGAGSAWGRHGAAWQSPQWCRPACFPGHQPRPPLSVFMMERQETHQLRSGHVSWGQTQPTVLSLVEIFELHQESPSSSGASSQGSPFTNTLSWTAASKFCTETNTSQCWAVSKMMIFSSTRASNSSKIFIVSMVSDYFSTIIRSL